MHAAQKKTLLASAFFLGLVLLLAYIFLKPPGPVFHYRLSNGLQIVLVPVHKSPIVTQMLWYKVGSADETEGKTGLAHFFEHLMFKGTEKVPEGRFTRIITELGGDNNAFTTSDATAYYASFAKEHLARIMELEADRMQGLMIGEQAFETERNVILEERLLRVDNVPRSRLVEAMRSALFKGHPYGQPTIGWEKDIRALTYGDAMDFHRRFYSPNNAVLVIAGDVTPKQVKKLAQRYFGAIPMQPAMKDREALPIPAEPVAQDRPIILTDPRIESAEWLRFYRVPSFTTTPDKKTTYALELLSYLLAGSDTGRFYQEFVIDAQKAAYVATSYDSLSRGPSIFSVYVLPAAGHSAAEIESDWHGLLTSLAEKGVSPPVLDRAKTTLVAEKTYAKDSIHALARVYGEAVITGAGIGYAAEWDENIRAVTSQDIQYAASLLLASENVTGMLRKQEVRP